MGVLWAQPVECTSTPGKRVGFPRVSSVRGVGVDPFPAASRMELEPEPMAGATELEWWLSEWGWGLSGRALEQPQLHGEGPISSKEPL